MWKWNPAEIQRQNEPSAIWKMPRLPNLIRHTKPQMALVTITTRFFEVSLRFITDAHLLTVFLGRVIYSCPGQLGAEWIDCSATLFHHDWQLCLSSQNISQHFYFLWNLCQLPLELHCYPSPRILILKSFVWWQPLCWISCVFLTVEPASVPHEGHFGSLCLHLPNASKLFFHNCHKHRGP